MAPSKRSSRFYAGSVGPTKSSWLSLTSALLALLVGAPLLLLLASRAGLSPSADSDALLPGSRAPSIWANLPSDYVVCSPRPNALRLDPQPPRSIYTGDEYVECVAVRNGTIAHAGSEQDVVHNVCGVPLDADAPARKPPGRPLPRGNKAARLERNRLRSAANAALERCNVRRLPTGHILYPGFQDAHGHILDFGWSRTVVHLVGSQSVQEVIKRIEDYIRASPKLMGLAMTADEHLTEPLPWIEGLGWDQTKWDPPVFPTGEDLSRSPLLRRFPISLRRIDVHALWLSQKGIDLVEKSAKGFPSSPAEDHKVHGGLVIRHPDGRPTGVLVDNAMNLAYQVIPKWTSENRYEFLQAAAKGLLAAGITAVGDAATEIESAELFKRLDDEGKLPFRIYSFLACPPNERRCAHRVKQIIPTEPSRRFTMRTVKLFADGALGSWGSAMWEDYSDNPGERGLLLIPEKEIEPIIRYWMDRGWQVGTHAIGDKTNTLVLDAYESILRESGEKDGQRHRPRVEHAQIMRLQDTARFGQLGVIASMQPTHCTSDMGYVEKRIGAQRAKGAYPWKTLLNQNATLALGSDFPVELPDPLHGIYSSVTRLDAEGNSPAGPGGWYPEERISRKEALRGFTLDTSFAQYEENVAGSIHAGKRADFTVLDRDILDEAHVTPLMLREAKVQATIIDGKVAWDRQEQAARSRRPSRQASSALASELAQLILDEVSWLVQGLGHRGPPSHTVAGATLLLATVAAVFLLRRFSSDPYSSLSGLALNTRRPTTNWLNMGFWVSDENELPDASRMLAEILQDAAGIGPNSRVLDVGCGAGDSVLLLRERFSPAVLHAVTLSDGDAKRLADRLEKSAAEKDKSVAVWSGDAIRWLIATSGDAGEEQLYDVILALDCAYHFQTRTDFIKLASKRLAPGGKLALFDLITAYPTSTSAAISALPNGITVQELPPPTCAPSLLASLRHKLTCTLLNVATSNLWSWDRYASELRACGFADEAVRMSDISAGVFPGFARFLQSLGTGDESAWRGGGAGMLMGLRSFGDVVERWGRGGDEGMVRGVLVVAEKDAEAK